MLEPLPDYLSEICAALVKEKRKSVKTGTAFKDTVKKKLRDGKGREQLVSYGACSPFSLSLFTYKTKQCGLLTV